MDFDQIVAKYSGERYQAHLDLLFEGISENFSYLWIKT